MRKVDLARAILLGSSASLFFAVPAIAQTAEEATQQAADQPPADEATTAANDEGEDTAGENITVTARRTEERLQDVPAAVSAFNERALDRIQAVDPTGLQGAVPNLNIVQGRGSSNAMNIYIRGVGQPDALQTFDPAVGVYVDDVYLSRIRGTQLDLLDIERIEVLRGPQGTLYGKNTIGGALKVVTRRPGDSFRANGSVAFGSYGQFEVKGSVSGPFNDAVSMGIALMKSVRGGYVEDELNGREYNDKDTTALRGDIAITPSERLRIDLSADYSWDDAAMTVGQPLNDLTTLLSPVVPILPVGNKEEDGYDFTAQISPGLPNSTELRHRGISLTAAYDVSDALTVKSISALRKMDTADYIDIDASIWNSGDVFVDVDQKQFSQEAQLLYKGDRLSGVAGLYYLHERVKSHQEAYGSDLLRFSPLFPPIFEFLRTIDDDLDTKSYAAFVNGTYAITPAVNISAGIRYTHETKDYFRTTSRFFNGALFDVYNFEPDDSWDDWSPMASVDWHVAEDVMVYAKVAKGFKSGGFNGRANDPTGKESTTYKPETVWSYEAGVKSRWFDQLTLNATVFHNKYKDFQARVGGRGDPDPITNLPTPLLAVLNAGKLEINGAELEATWTPLTGLLLDGQVGYLDADYKEFEDERFPNGDRSFQTPAFSPKWTLRGGIQYSFGAGDFGDFTIGGQARYKSETALAVDNTFIVYTSSTDPGTGTTTEVPGLFQDGYWLADARIVWEDVRKRFAVGLYGNNLFDKEYKTDAQEFSSVGSIRTVYYGPPRTFTVRVTARY